MPASRITLSTSAKSRLIIPGTVIRSEIPSTPFRSTSSAISNAFVIGVSADATLSSLSFEMQIRASTFCDRRAMPSSAFCARAMPSNANGRVTMAVVRIPDSLASPAITGAAPVPVPPPIPAVMKTMSTPCRRSAISSRLSSAASLPTSGFPPAPSPWVSLPADLERLVRADDFQHLRVGVDDDQVDALDASVKHAVHDVPAAAASPRP